MTYEYIGRTINFDLIWRGSNDMFNHMDGIIHIKNMNKHYNIPEDATFFMFKVKNGWCHLGVPFDGTKCLDDKFTHFGWKVFKTENEKINALKNNFWMYTVHPYNYGLRYFRSSLFYVD